MLIAQTGLWMITYSSSLYWMIELQITVEAAGRCDEINWQKSLLSVSLTVENLILTIFNVIRGNEIRIEGWIDFDLASPGRTLSAIHRAGWHCGFGSMLSHSFWMRTTNPAVGRRHPSCFTNVAQQPEP